MSTLFPILLLITDDHQHHGIMSDYYISENARKIILEQIAHKAQKHVLDMTYQWYARAFRIWESDTDPN